MSNEMRPEEKQNLLQVAPKLVVPAEIRPNAAFGQNFMTDTAILQREISYAEILPTDTVLEIGPGLGFLTDYLCAAAGHVHAIEADPQFTPYLDGLKAAHPHFSYELADATVSPFPPCTKIVANLPYKISLPLIFKALEHDFETAVFIIQDRLAQRLCAKPGKVGYGRVSITAQRLGRFRLLETVKDVVFDPPPQVESAMIRIEKLHKPRFVVPDATQFKHMLDRFFLYRDMPIRKVLDELKLPIRLLLPAIPDQKVMNPVRNQTPEVFGHLARLLHGQVVFEPVSDVEKRKSQKLYPSEQPRKRSTVRTGNNGKSPRPKADFSGSAHNSEHVKIQPETEKNVPQNQPKARRVVHVRKPTIPPDPVAKKTTRPVLSLSSKKTD